MGFLELDGQRFALLANSIDLAIRPVFDLATVVLLGLACLFRLLAHVLQLLMRQGQLPDVL